MQEPTDDQLDGLFRKSAEEFDTPFDPAAWQVLKNRLDNHDRLTIWEHLLRWGLPVLLLLLLTGGSWNAHHQRTRAGQTLRSDVAVLRSASPNTPPVPARPTQRQQQHADDDRPLSNETVPGSPDETILGLPNETVAGLVKSDRPAPIAVAPPADGKRPEETTKTDRLNSTARTASATTPASTVAGGRAADRPTIRTGAVAVSTAPTGGTKRIRLATSGQQRSRRSSGRRTKNRVAPIFPAMNYAIEPVRSFTKRQVRQDAPGELPTKVSKLDGDLPAKADAIAEPVVLASFIELTNRPGQWPKPLSFTDREVTAPVSPAGTDQPPLSVQPTPVQKGLSVRFVASPDLSAIGLRNFQRPGTNVGLLLEYRLASRWSVQAGVIQSTKVYKALLTDYKLSDDYLLKLKLLPESINGRCNMLDIPVNVRYDVAIRPRLSGQMPSRWFVSGGTTTYIMRQEDYDYTYAEADQKHIYSTTPKGWHGPPTGRYNFSQLNLSAGYERALGRRLAWQVEPFVKMPLKGVGFLKINLLSTGAFFSLRYKL